MGSGEPVTTPEVYEQFIWPEIARLERHYRRTDRLFFPAAILGVMCLAAGAAAMDGPNVIQALVIGALAPLGMNVGIAFQRTLDRRRCYRQMEQLHFDAEHYLLARELEP